jgi:hypothetical protein
LTSIFMHNDQPVQVLQESVMLATTTRAMKGTCFEPFLRTGNAGQSDDHSGRVQYQVAVIGYFADLCVGVSAMCEAKCQSILPMNTCLTMLAELRSQIDATKVDASAGAALTRGQLDKDNQRRYTICAALTRLLAECYFETDVREDSELMQNDALWSFIEGGISVLNALRTDTTKASWHNPYLLDYAGKIVFALILFYDNVYDDASYHGAYLGSLLKVTRDISAPRIKSEETLPEELGATPAGRVLYSYTCGLVDEFSRLINRKKHYEAPQAESGMPASFPAWVAARKGMRGAWTAVARKVEKHAMDELRSDAIMEATAQDSNASKSDSKWTGMKLLFENNVATHHGSDLSEAWRGVLKDLDSTSPGEVREVDKPGQAPAAMRVSLDGPEKAGSSSVSPVRSSGGKRSPSPKHSPGKSDTQTTEPPPVVNPQKTLDDFVQRFRSSVSVRQALKADMDRFAKV